MLGKWGLDAKQTILKARLITMSKYYDNWRAEKHSCRVCGWQGLGSELRQGEMFEALFEINCPKCGERVDVIELPTIEESRANWHKVSPADRAVIEVIEARMRSQHLARPRSTIWLVASWVGGIFAFFALVLIFVFIGDFLGVPTAHVLDKAVGSWVDGNYYESDSSTTSFGMSSAIFALVLSIWAGRAMYYKAWNGGLAPRSLLTLHTWLYACMTLMFAGAILDLAMRSVHGAHADLIQLIFQCLITCGVVWAWHQWWKNRADSRAKK
jgi:hypothetical protein